MVTDLPQTAQSTRLPSGWKVVTLGEIGEALIGLTYDPACVSSHGTLVLRSSNIQNDELSLDDNVFVRTPIPERLRTRSGDILICVRNGSASLIGKCLHLNERMEGETFGAFMAVFRSPEHRYVFHQFRSGAIKRQIGEQLGATINQITNASLNSFTIPFPRDPQERAAIASVLDDLDSLTASIAVQLAKRRDLRTAVAQSLLTGQIRLSGFEEPYRRVVLRDLLEVRHGKSQHEVECSTGPYPILGTGGVMGSSKVALYPGPSVLIGRKGTIDSPQYMDTPFWTIDTLFYTEIAPQANPKFVFYLFQTIPWKSHNEASGVPSLNAKTIEAIEVCVPATRDEQTAIACVLTAMDVEIEALAARLSKTRDLKTAMAQELLSGRTRLV